MGLERVDALSADQVNDLIDLYRKEWWTQERNAEDVRRMLRGTNVVVGFCDADTRRLVAFARVLTDGIYKALVLDVIVAPSHRNIGLGKRLIGAVMTHPALQAVRHFELYCRPEMVPFYERWGFTDDLGHLRLMRSTRHPSSIV